MLLSLIGGSSDMKISELVDKQKGFNTGQRTILESVMSDAVLRALKDWFKYSPSPGVLVGGLVVSFYNPSRMTQDVDVLYPSKNSLPETVEGFKRHRPSAFIHDETHVEIELLYPGYISVPEDVIKFILDTAIISDGVKVASKEGMIASKLFRGNYQDKHDITLLIKHGDINFDLLWPILPERHAAILRELAEDAITYEHGTNSGQALTLK
jgi:hypothetical protein